MGVGTTIPLLRLTKGIDMNPEQFIRVQVERKARDAGIAESVIPVAQDNAVHWWRAGRKSAAEVIEEAVKSGKKQRGMDQ